jgi:hypothetical protein
MIESIRYKSYVSAAGKSYLQDTVLSLVPKEGCTKYTRLTDQAIPKRVDPLGLFTEVIISGSILVSNG